MLETMEQGVETPCKQKTLRNNLEKFKLELLSGDLERIMMEVSREVAEDIKKRKAIKEAEGKEAIEAHGKEETMEEAEKKEAMEKAMKEAMEDAEKEDASRELYKLLPSDIKSHLEEFAGNLSFPGTADSKEATIKIWGKIPTNTRAFLLVKESSLNEADEDAYGRIDALKKLKESLEMIDNKLDNGIECLSDVNLEELRNEFRNHQEFFDNYRSRSEQEIDFKKLQKQLMEIKLEKGSNSNEVRDLLVSFNEKYANVGDYSTSKEIDDNKALKNLFKNIVNDLILYIRKFLEEIDKKIEDNAIRN